MFGKVKKFLYKVVGNGEKLFDFGHVIGGEGGKRKYTRISMSLNAKGGRRFVCLGFKRKSGGNTSYSWSHIPDASALAHLRDACDQVQMLLESGLSDDEIKALNNRLPDQGQGTAS